MSHKADTVIELLAGKAIARGYQVLSFDLPEHGDRKTDPTPCKVAECVRDLETVMEYACARWNHIGLFGCSMGAYFSLLAYRDCNLEQCLFLSPVVDMERLIESMMSWSNVTPDQLREQGDLLLRGTNALLGLLLLRESPSHRPLDSAHPHPVRGAG